eukprot:m.204676 g.204676  ORF g.204676 m.204676 type:complete len:536 (+) comp32896_c0_seq1:391-1998(+)
MAIHFTMIKILTLMTCTVLTASSRIDRSNMAPLRPHIVFVMIDDLGWNDIGFHDTTIKSPMLDSLAADGVYLKRHYVYRYCSPTRASFLSGRLPYHAHQTNPGTESSFGTNVNMTLLPAKLKAVGYRTAMRGKWHLGGSRTEYLPFARGFDDAAGYLSGACDHYSEVADCSVDSWVGNASYNGPDRRNGTGYDSFRHATDMVGIINRQPHDPRPLFLYAALHTVHQPIEAPDNFVNLYANEPWCSKKKTIAGMVSVADNVTAQLVTALRQQHMWSTTVMVVSSDNGGDTDCSSNYPLRGRKRTFFEGGVRAVAFIHSALLPASRRGGRMETAFIHVSDWYVTFNALAGVVDNPDDSGPGRFKVDGENVWPYLADETGTVRKPHSNTTLVLGYNYSTLAFPSSSTPSGYSAPSGAIIEVSTGYKLIVATQHSCGDSLSWDPATYPCTTTPPGSDCNPYCLFNIVTDESERDELVNSASPKDKASLKRLTAYYESIKNEIGMPNQNDIEWNEQGKPFDPRACEKAKQRGYWGPWLDV